MEMVNLESRSRPSLWTLVEAQRRKMRPKIEGNVAEEVEFVCLPEER